MFHVTPELAHAIHDDRRRRLLADAESHRRRRAARARRRGERRERSLRRRFATLWRRRRSVDAKVARIGRSWMNPTAAAASRLAATADEICVPAGTSLAPGRFAYVALDDRHARLVVTDHTGPVALASEATLLVMSLAELREMSTAIPALAAAQAPRSDSGEAPPRHVPRCDAAAGAA